MVVGCDRMLARFTTPSASVVTPSAIYVRRCHGGRHHVGAASGAPSIRISPRNAGRATLRVRLTAGVVLGNRFTISG